MPSGTESFVRLRGGRVDKLKPQASVPPTEVQYEDTQPLPRQPVETERGQVNVDGWDLWCFDPAADIVDSDQIRFRGQVYNVIGTPRRFDKRGIFKGLQITISKVS